MSEQRGSASVELMIITVYVFLFTAVMVMAGRMTLAHQTADAAAYAAARSASLARTELEAEHAARDAADAWFTSQGIVCTRLEVYLHPEGFRQPVGQAATVSVDVECEATLEDIALKDSGIPGSITLTSSFVSPLDRYRSRT